MGKTFRAFLLCLPFALAGMEISHAASPQEAEKFTHIAGLGLWDVFSFNDSAFADLASKLGKSQVKESGDAATGNNSICFRTAHGEAVVEFFQGEVDMGFTVRTPDASDIQCPKSHALTPADLDIAGIKLGMSRSSYEQLVGKASRSTPARVQHEFHYEQTLTDAELNVLLERARRSRYPLNPEGWRRWHVDIFLGADFTQGHLTSITVSRSAQN